MTALLAALLGAALGAGLVLALSPALWPRPEPGRPAVPAPAIAPAQNRLARAMALAGMRGVSPVAFAAISITLGLIAGGAAQALLGIAVLAVVMACACAALPLLLVAWRAAARRAANRAVWPDVVDQLVSMVRSGHSLPDALGSLGQSGPQSTRAPFVEFERDYRASANFGACVNRLKDAIADPVADRILETLRMAREVGGTELTVLLRGLAGYLREDAAVRAELHSRQGWIVNAARLGVAAPWIVLLLLSTRPEAAAAYNTPAGAAVILAGLLVSVLAYRVMVRVGRLPHEQRWFR